MTVHVAAGSRLFISQLPSHHSLSYSSTWTTAESLSGHQLWLLHLIPLLLLKAAVMKLQKVGRRKRRVSGTPFITQRQHGHYTACSSMGSPLAGGHSPAACSGERAHQVLSWAAEAVFILQTWAVSFAQLLYSTASKVHKPGVKNSVLSKTVHFPNSNTEAGDILNVKIVVKQDALFCRLQG